MKAEHADIIDVINWRDRRAVRITNDRIELIALLGGGHFAVFRYLEPTKAPSHNVLWEAPWKTCEPDEVWSEQKTSFYGDPREGRFLASYSGHALCLDYFGPPTEAAAEIGLSLHGEAAITSWNASSSESCCNFNVELTRSGLSLKRVVRMRAGESVVSVQESVFNAGSVDHICDWVQHVTFGPPFLCDGEGNVATSGKQGIISLSSKEGLSPTSCEFVWPAVREAGGTSLDLRKPFSKKAQGILAGIKLDPDRDIQFLLAYNVRLGIGMGYCFRRRDFPWLTIWEENCGRIDAPWNGRTQARGMEFGTNPLPAGKHPQGTYQWEVPIGCVIPANGSRTVCYQMFLFTIEPWGGVPVDVGIKRDMLVLYDEMGDVTATVPSVQCSDFLHS